MKEDHEEAMINKRKLEESDVSTFVVPVHLRLLLNNCNESFSHFLFWHGIFLFNAILILGRVLF